MRFSRSKSRGGSIAIPRMIIGILIIILVIGGFKIVSDFIVNSKPGYSYEVVSYNTDIKVDVENKYYVREDIVINFYDPNVKIHYNIPLKDGNSKFDLLNINVSENISYDVKKTKDFYTLIFNSKYNTGEQEIKFDYSIDKGDDYDSSKDTIKYTFYNIESPNASKNYTFSITYPASKLRTLRLDQDGVDVKDNFDLRITNEFVSGILKQGHTIKDSFTIEVDEEEGYFTNETDYNSINGMFIVFYLVITIVYIILWFFKGKDDRVIPIPVFDVPSGMNPLEIGYWENKDIEYNEIFYMIMYWANKGYIKIRKNSNETSRDEVSELVIGDYTFIKVKELDINAHEYEKQIFKAFFELGNEEDSPGDFNVKEFLKETSSLYGTLQTYAQDLYEAEETFRSETLQSESDGYDKGAENLFNAMKVITFALWGISIFFYSELSFGTFSNYFPIVIVMLTAFLGLFLQKDTFYNYMIFTLPIMLIISISTINGFVLMLLTLMTVLTGIVRKRTFEYNELLGKIRGFANVISQSKYNNEIGQKISENNMYFYDILPYALTLKCEKKWINRFQTIPTPSWYESFDGTPLTSANIVEFVDDFNELCRAILLNVNNSATSDKKKTPVEGIYYESKGTQNNDGEDE